MKCRQRILEPEFLLKELDLEEKAKTYMPAMELLAKAPRRNTAEGGPDP
jgi:hypothetical protein